MFFRFMNGDRLRRQGLLCLLICVVAIGVFLRGVNLGQKPYWFDETYTLLRVSGYSEQEVVNALFTGEIIKAGDFLPYQTATSDRGAIGTILGLAQEEPQLPPLYFLAAKFWAQSFGSSKAAMRSLSVIGSLLSFPVLYWLCWELFAAPTVGWMAMALFALSPINLRYAQEIRQYSFWLTLVLLTCVLLLRAIRQPTRLNWGVYIGSMVVALYCHLLTLLVLIGQGLYVWGLAGFRITRAVLAYLLAFVLCLVCLLPWVWIVWQNRSAAMKMLAWVNVPLPLSNLAQGAAASFIHLFFAWPLQYHYPLIYLAIPGLALALYALYYLYRNTPVQTWLLILSLVGFNSLPFLFADLLWGGRRTANERYFFVAYVAILIALAYLLTVKLTARSIAAAPAISRSTRLWQGVTVLLLSGSLLSCGLGSWGSTWWGWSEFDLESAAIVHRASYPLVISDLSLGLIMPLARELHPEVNMQLLGNGLSQSDRLDLPDEFSDIFLYHPSQPLLDFVRQQGTEPELVYAFRDPATTHQFSLYQIRPKPAQSEGSG